jgi:hypothetical protein
MPTRWIWESEEIYYVAQQLFDDKGGEVMCAITQSRSPAWPVPSLPAICEDEGHQARRYPKLSQRFGAEALG